MKDKRMIKPLGPPLVMGHQADGTVYCTLCGITGHAPFPCDRHLEREHFRYHRERREGD